MKLGDEKIIKPCELSLKKEELLKQYFNADNNFKDTYIKTLEEYNEELKILNEKYKDDNDEKIINDNYKYIKNELKVLIKSSKSI